MTVGITGPAGRVISAVLIVVMFATQVGLAPSAYAGSPPDDLKTIQYKYYFRGKYAEAVVKLQTFLARTDLAAEVALSAREFLAASLVLSGSPEQGRSEFMAIIADMPAYAGPDPAVFKSVVVSNYNEARAQYASARLRQAPSKDDDDDDSLAGAAAGGGASVASRPLYKQWWFYAGIATVLVVLGAVSSEKSDGSDPVPNANTGTITVGVTIR